MIARGLIVMIAIALASPSEASFAAPESYETYVAGMLSQLGDIAEARGLEDVDATNAIREAAAWIHLGPCRGDAQALPKDIGYAGEWIPSIPLHAATLEMIAIMMQPLGREPSERLCRFALGVAAPYGNER